MAATTLSAPGSVSVPVAIVLGLISSFVQSLGLTIQRKSHMQNDNLPADEQRSEWRRKSWVAGFAIFLFANIGGTVFQIGALPIVMLAPLGAVSLLFNALLARFLLDDFFSRYMLSGTALIAVGAVFIGYFGVVQAPPHSLDELLALYARPAFVAFASIFTLIFVGVLAIAHLAEWQLHIRLFRPHTIDIRRRFSPRRKRSMRRRWSAPSLAPVVEVSESSSGIATPVLEIADEAARRGVPVDRVLMQRGQHFPTHPRHQRKPNYGSMARSQSHSEPQVSSDGAQEDPQSTSAAAMEASLHDPSVRKICFGLAIAYGGCSGTLSGACLLLAKSGVELLVLTFGGHNQFDRWQSWFLVFVMLLAALLQLWYLNKSLRLASPPLVCPLAFCFYNTSSIALGLIYFDQLGALPITSILAVILGIVVLLAGVWIVSLHGAPDSSVEKQDGETTETTALLGDERAELVNSPLQATPSPLTSPQGDAVVQTESLLANAGGIGGPHLPVPPSNAVQSPETSRSPSATSPRSASQSQHRRARSASSSLMGGLGLHMPGLPTQPALQSNREGTDEEAVAVEEGQTGPEPPGSPTRRRGSSSSAASPRSPPAQLSLLTSPPQRRRGLYESVLERGLSIGISPSSPGFHVGSTFEVEHGSSGPTTEHEANAAREIWRRRIFGQQRRSFSEADTGSAATRNDD